jgi:hypothetical protein
MGSFIAKYKLTFQVYFKNYISNRINDHSWLEYEITNIANPQYISYSNNTQSDLISYALTYFLSRQALKDDEYALSGFRARDPIIPAAFNGTFRK